MINQAEPIALERQLKIRRSTNSEQYNQFDFAGNIKFVKAGHKFIIKLNVQQSTEGSSIRMAGKIIMNSKSI